MTSDKYGQEENAASLDEKLSGLEEGVNKLRTIVGGVYDRVTDLMKRTESVYDMIAYRNDVPIFDPAGIPDDFLGDLEEE